ncbi:MAG: Hsp20/alpha crystallin family protein [Roseivirga sp.]
MNIVKRSHFLPNSSFFDDFLSKDLFERMSPSHDGNRVPLANIIESNEFFRVEIAAPGMEKEHFQISLDNDTLTISSDLSEHSLQQDDQVYTRREFSYQSFKRSFHLPNTVEADKIEATYNNGILSLIIPKKEEAKKQPVRTIQIS